MTQWVTYVAARHPISKCRQREEQGDNRNRLIALFNASTVRLLLQQGMQIVAKFTRQQLESACRQAIFTAYGSVSLEGGFQTTFSVFAQCRTVLNTQLRLFGRKFS